ncbi:hypothetical protein BWD09_04370 [Neisseria dentiae]|uniref:Uncharacterized protein n=1 Tax=Neisseria dentiae TaxID=194197 RepID=A0A1X3DD32_9NEIS|nr:hypothetical protein [Neisseria dentiae]OSI17828.1 hypothetical protein BWD09_04370 [Neisseria dentiae]QMT45936.1 hypothetical protein H3L92_03825 [Neisseria dentiae]
MEQEESGKNYEAVGFKGQSAVEKACCYVMEKYQRVFSLSQWSDSKMMAKILNRTIGVEKPDFGYLPESGFEAV